MKKNYIIAISIITVIFAAVIIRSFTKIAPDDITSSLETTRADQTSPSGSDALIGTQWSGTIEGRSELEYSSSFYDYKVTWVEMGEFTFIITKPKYVLKINGSGSGKTTAKWTGDCTAEGSLTTGLIIEGRVNEATGNLEFGIRDDFAGREAHAFVTRQCRSPKWTGVRPSNDSFSASFDFIPPFSLEPVSGASAEGSIHFFGEEDNMKYKVTIGKGLSAQDFDFDVDVDPPVVTIKQDKTADINVVVRLLRGDARDITMTVTDWGSNFITSWFDDSVITPTQTGALTKIHIQPACDTEPGEYLHTIQGEAGTRSSVDSVNVKVTESLDC